MTRPADINRARAGLGQVLASRNELERALEACDSRSLQSILGQINGRKQAQTERLLEWLQRPGVTSSSAGPEDSAVATVPLQTTLTAERSPDEPEPSAAPGTVTVLERREVTADLLILKLSRPADFAFRPGQSVKLGLAGLERRYSIVSAPHEPNLEFFIELNPGGQMSAQLRTLGVGDSLTLTGLKGQFLLDERVPQHLMIATVTGINPFVSMLRDALHHGRREQRFYIFHGASYCDEFGYDRELQSLAAAHPGWLTYIPTVSRPDEARNAGWNGSCGRVGTILDEFLGSQSGLDSGSLMIYACGNPEMVTDVEARYRKRGFEIKTERY